MSHRVWRDRVVMSVALLIFAGASWYGFSGLDIDFAQIQWWAVIVLLVVGVPASTVANAAEFTVSGRLLGQQHSFVRSLRVAVLGVAANILPIPGGALVRVAMLKRAGATTAQATGATLVAALVWSSATAIVAGGLFAPIQPVIGGGAVAAGLVGIAVSVGAAQWRLRPTQLASSMGLLVGVELLSVLIGALRLWLVLQAAGQEVALSQAGALTVAGVVASATGILPGGLGIREVLAAAIGPLVDLPARVSLVAASGNRIAEYLVLGPVALAFTLRPDPRVRDAVEAERQERETEGQQTSEVGAP